MVAQHFYPEEVPPSMLDHYLSKGWFRGSSMLYRSSVLYLDQELHEVINIRLPLKNYEPKKRLRRIKRKVHEAFRVVVRPFENSIEKELLYENHKHRFRGYLQDTLLTFLKGEDEERQHLSIFDTYEVCVYDNETLVGFSLFDVGEVAVASILGIFDEYYHQYSIGLFTMLQEIEYAQSLGYQYYYPGYILSNTRVFDYKLRVGKMEFYNHHQQWQTIEELHTLEKVSDLIVSKIEAVEQFAEAYGIPYKRSLYPMFSLAYFESETMNFVRSPIILLLFEEEVTDDALVLEYWKESDEYAISQIKVYVHFSFADLSDSESETTSSIIDYSDLLAYEQIIAHDKEPEALFGKLMQHFQKVKS